MPSLLSGRSKVTPSENLTVNRYNFVSLSQAQPALGRPDIDRSVLVGRLDGTTQWVSQATLTVGAAVQNVLYVSKSGNDNNDGSSLSNSKATIKSALAISTPGTTIIVMSGDYVERNPINVPANVAVIGHDTQVVVTPLYANLNVFQLNSNSAVQGITVSNHAEPSFAFTIAPDAKIVNAPIVKDCSSVTGPFLNDGTLFVPGSTIQNPLIVPGDLPLLDSSVPDITKRVDPTGAGGGILVDGDAFASNSVERSIEVINFRAVNQGGIGILVKNNASANVQASSTQFCSHSFRTELGGTLNLNGCVSNVGTYGLTSDGFETVPYITGAEISQTAYSSVSAISVSSQGAGYTVEPQVIIDPPTDPLGIQATAEAIINNGQVTNIVITEEGSGYSTVPDVQFVGSSSSPAAAVAELSGLSQISVGLISARPVIGSLIDIQGYVDKFYVSASTPVVGNNTLVSVTPTIFYVNLGEDVSFYNNSKIIANGHVFNYVGAGVTYNALPDQVGTGITENNVVETNYGKVFYSSLTDNGIFNIGNLFSVNQVDGSSSISSSLFNLTDISAIGPFIRDGVPVGVQLREVSNDITLTASTGIQDSFTAPTQYAVATYVNNNYLSLSGGTVNGSTTINDLTFEDNKITSLTLDVNNIPVIDVNNARIKNLRTPTSASDAATKEYVDALVSGITPGGGLINAYIGDLYLHDDTIENYQTNGNLLLTTNGLGIVNVTSDIDSSSPTTGALVVDGGVGIGKKLYVGTSIHAPTFFGNVTGNVSGSAATVTNSSQTAITQVGNLIDVTAGNIKIFTNTIKNISSNANLILGTTGSGDVIPETNNLIDFGSFTNRWAHGYFTDITGTIQTGLQPNITDLSKDVNIFDSTFNTNPTLDIGYNETNKFEITTTNYSSTSLLSTKFVTYTNNLGTSPGRFEFYPNQQLSLTIDNGQVSVSGKLSVNSELSVLDPLIVLGPATKTVSTADDVGVLNTNNNDITSSIVSVVLTSNGITNSTIVNLDSNVDIIGIKPGDYLYIDGTVLSGLNSLWQVTVANAGQTVVNIDVTSTIPAGVYTQYPTTAILSREIFFGYQRSSDSFTFISNAQVSGNTVTGTSGTINAKIISNSAAITGGSINGTPIGNISRSSGEFTTVTANSFSTDSISVPSSITISNADPTIIDSFDKFSYDVVKYTAKIKDLVTGAITGQDIMLVNDGISVYQSEYGIVHSINSLGNFSSDIVGTNVELSFTPLSTNDTAVAIFKIYV